ncbi:VOC family protein [Nocardioides daeguensis]|uniref:VOC family protein n=1 Tax=Nocardioides daeguensis TaxID=908359 RepID=A0ABP6V7K0_9ACTN|nr:VOC family protein [Nocardioides daeguensis]MBV6726323.1 VOC family protein [Nocardioides daeguensis]MCR1772166.1 VOC family protein [Nocardioides daeguensis]
MAIARNPQFVLDCPDPQPLAAFYGALLGWAPQVDADGGWATVSDGDRHLHFQRVDDYRAPDWPGQDVPQQVHLDVDVDDLDEAEEATLALGATKHPHQPGTSFRVFLDPAGHPFCLCQG